MAVAHRVIEGAGLNLGLAADGELSASGGVRSSHVLESRVGGLIDSRPAAKRLPFFWNLPGPYVVFVPPPKGRTPSKREGGWEVGKLNVFSGIQANLPRGPVGGWELSAKRLISRLPLPRFPQAWEVGRSGQGGGL